MIYLSSDTHFGHVKDFLWRPRGFSSVEEMNERTGAFLELLGLKPNGLMDKYKAREDIHAFGQDVHERDNTLPFFVLPISSVSKINIDPIKYALSDIVTKVRDEKSSC